MNKLLCFANHGVVVREPASKKEVLLKAGFHIVPKKVYKKYLKSLAPKYPMNPYNFGTSTRTVRKGYPNMHNFRVQLITETVHAKQDMGFTLHKAKVYHITDPATGTVRKVKSGKAIELGFVTTMVEEELLRTVVTRTIRHQRNPRS